MGKSPSKWFLCINEYTRTASVMKMPYLFPCFCPDMTFVFTPFPLVPACLSRRVRFWEPGAWPARLGCSYPWGKTGCVQFGSKNKVTYGNQRNEMCSRSGRKSCIPCDSKEKVLQMKLSSICIGSKCSFTPFHHEFVKPLVMPFSFLPLVFSLVSSSRFAFG